MGNSEVTGSNDPLSHTNGLEHKIIATYTLGERPISEVQNTLFPGSIQNDRGFFLGGLGSGLWRNPSDPENEFWMVTDRGPNGKVIVNEQLRRTFPIPEYTPVLVRVHTGDTDVHIEQVLPLRGSSGKPILGLSNLEGKDESPYDFQAETALAYNPSGLDPEDLIRTSTGEFWLADEYRPSLVRVSAEGVVLKRFIPQGVELPGADYPVAAVLPAIYARRKLNRGFEGLGLSPNQTTLFAVLESPLANPDTPTSDNSRNTRILAFDITTERPVAEYVYRFEEVSTFDPAITQADMKVSGIVALPQDALLILEHTDAVARLYKVDLSRATNILNTKWADPATRPSLEMCQDLSEVEVAALPKSLVIDLTTLPGMPNKIEGLAVVDRQTLAVANDNDFGIGSFDQAGNNSGSNVKSQVLIIRLATPLF
jgi:hypothetical protein